MPDAQTQRAADAAEYARLSRLDPLVNKGFPWYRNPMPGLEAYLQHVDLRRHRTTAPPAPVAPAPPVSTPARPTTEAPAPRKKPKFVRQSDGSWKVYRGPAPDRPMTPIGTKRQVAPSKHSRREE